MAETLESLKAKAQEIIAASKAERAEVLAKLQEVVTPLKDEIKRLSDQIANGVPVTQADLDSLGSTLDEGTAEVRNVVRPEDNGDTQPV